MEVMFKLGAAAKASKYAFEKILYYYFLNSKTKVINLKRNNKNEGVRLIQLRLLYH